MTVSAIAARIVKAVQSLYEVNNNHTLVIEQFITAFYSKLSVLGDQPLSHNAQLHWYKQLQAMQLQNRCLFMTIIRLGHFKANQGNSVFLDIQFSLITTCECAALVHLKKPAKLTFYHQESYEEKSIRISSLL